MLKRPTKKDKPTATSTGKGFLKNTLETGAYFLERLQELAKEHSIIKNVRGKGLILAIELKKPGSKVVLECMENGFLINCIRQNILRLSALFGGYAVTIAKSLISMDTKPAKSLISVSQIIENL